MTRSGLRGAWSLTSHAFLSVTGGAIALGSYGDLVELAFPVYNLRSAPSFPPLPWSSIRAAAWSPDGKYIAAADDEMNIRVWESTDLRSLFRSSRPDDSTGGSTSSRPHYTSISWSPDTGLVAATNMNGSLTVVRVRRWKFR